MGSVRNISLKYCRLAEKLFQTRKYNVLSSSASSSLNTISINNNKQFDNRLLNKLCRCELNKTTTNLIGVTSKHKWLIGAQYSTIDDNEKQLSKWQLLKKMYKEYWYIALPVHLITSAAWFGGFYYVATSGFDIVGQMESYGFNELLIKPFRDSTMGYFAVSYALYKVFTPLRYTVTLGGTTLAINYLKRRGYIKPVPSRDQLQKRFEEKKDELQASYRETKKEIKQRRQNITHDIAHYRSEIKSLGDITAKKIGIKNTVAEKKNR